MLPLPIGEANFSNARMMRSRIERRSRKRRRDLNQFKASEFEDQRQASIGEWVAKQPQK